MNYFFKMSQHGFDSGNGPDSLTPSQKGRKRKRQTEAAVSAGSSRASTPDVSGTKQPRAKRSAAKSKAKPQLERHASSFVEPLIEWPETFKTLEKSHRALNLVYTFCCTRKHLVTTFETIKSTVESQTKKTITIEEVASIVAIRPEGIKFAYVDEVMLQLDIRGAERDDVFKSGKSFRSHGPAADASVGGYTGMETLDEHHNRELAPSGREVLFFEFIDGDLKRQVQDKKTGEATRANRKLRNEDLKIPVFSQKQMTTLIEKRNQKFSNAINVFLNKCVEDTLDPEIALQERTKAFIPEPSAKEDDGSLIAPEVIPEQIPKERKSIPEIVEELKKTSWYTGQIVPDGHRVFEPQEPVHGDLNFLLSQDLVNALYNTKGITGFYAHQAEALNGLHDGHNVVVATSTSSGKSLIYQLPIVYALESDYNSRAMYIFPTKALAQDQKRSLKDLIGFMPGLQDVMVETFDGDTPMEHRNAIREEARIIFTNPDMLHITILPQEERWRSFLKNLKYVVGKSVDRVKWFKYTADMNL